MLLFVRFADLLIYTFCELVNVVFSASEIFVCFICTRIMHILSLVIMVETYSINPPLGTTEN